MPIKSNLAGVVEAFYLTIQTKCGDLLVDESIREERERERASA